MIIWTIKSEPEEKGPRRIFIYLLTEQAERWVPKPHSRPKYKQIAFHCSIWLNPHLFTLWHLHLTQLGKANFFGRLLDNCSFASASHCVTAKEKVNPAVQCCFKPVSQWLPERFNLHKTFSHFSFCNLTPRLQIN